MEFTGSSEDFDELVGVNEIGEESLIIYPNPFTSEISIKSSQQYDTFDITDLTGKLILSDKFNQVSVLGLEHLNSGMYFLTLRNNEEKRTQIIQKK